MVDAYAMVKLLTAAGPETEIGVVVNAARDDEEGRSSSGSSTWRRSGSCAADLRYYGYIARDPAVARGACSTQRPLVDQRPDSPASRCFRVARRPRMASLAPAARAAAWSRAARRPRRRRSSTSTLEARRCA